MFLNRYNVAMRKILLFLLCSMAVCTGAETVRSVTAETTRMSPDTLKKYFKLKEGEAFTEKEYQRAQEKEF